MGVKSGISMDEWPEQGAFLNREVEVMFNYDSKRRIRGTVVRDDAQGITIIRLDDGRFVLGTECQFGLAPS